MKKEEAKGIMSTEVQIHLSMKAIMQICSFLIPMMIFGIFAGSTAGVGRERAKGSGGW